MCYNRVGIYKKIIVKSLGDIDESKLKLFNFKLSALISSLLQCYCDTFILLNTMQYYINEILLTN